MADAADIAADRAEIAIAARLSRVDAAIPAGVAGECDDCGEIMPRLVGGRCGFCRDGRRPPLATYDRLTPVVPPAAKEQKPMSQENAQSSRKIAITGLALLAVERLAETSGVTFQQAAAELIWAGAQPADPDDLAAAPIENLMAELGRRVAAASPEELAEANARAAAAERRIAAITAVLGGEG